jgi:RNA processing factor Prp31
MMNIGKSVSKAIGPILAQNKGQAGLIGDLVKNIGKTLGSGDAGALKSLTGDLSKALKLVEAQTQVLAGIEVPEADGKADKAQADVVREINDALKTMLDENRRQTAAIEDLAREVEAAGKDGGGRDDAKKVKTASDLLEKARKLVDEQSKLLEEVRKVMAA